MLSPLKKINNESGVVLFIVLMTAIIIMILAVGIMSQSVNELNYSQQQIDQTTCDQLKTAYFWSAYSANALPAAGFTTTVNGRSYTISYVKGVMVGGETPWRVSCSFDSFQ